ncbi:hypothetical protein [Nostoc sp.]
MPLEELLLFINATNHICKFTRTLVCTGEDAIARLSISVVKTPN